MRKLQIRRSQERYLRNKKNKINKNALFLADQFIAGLNHYIAVGNTSLEFKLLNFSPKQWSLLDILSIGGVVTLSFAEGIIADTLMASLLEDFDQELLKELVIKMKNDRTYKNFKAKKRALLLKKR